MDYGSYQSLLVAGRRPGAAAEGAMP